MNQRRLTIGIALFVLIAFFAPGAKEEEYILFARIGDAAHYPAFALLAYAIFCTFQARGCTREAALRLALGSGFLLAAVVELIQPLVNRSASVEDLFNGWLGVVVLLVGLDAWTEPAPRTYRITHLLSAVLGGVIVLLPVWSEWQTIQWQARVFPLLGSFENQEERALWRGHAGDDISLAEVSFASWYYAEGKHSLQITTKTGSWSGVEYRAGTQDWPQQAVLRFALFNPGPPFLLGLRIDDREDCKNYDDRYNRSWQMMTGWNAVEIPVLEIENGPKNRQLDLTRMKRILFFAGKDQPSRTFYVDDVRLETSSKS